MDTKTPISNPSSSGEKDVNGDSVGKKGKKRARGAADEVVVAGIEGRGGRGLSGIEGLEIMSALRRESLRLMMIPRLVSSTEP